jgi:hypothetical protein
MVAWRMAHLPEIFPRWRRSVTRCVLGDLSIV